MVSSLFYSPRALLAIIWLCVLLHLTWPKRDVPTTTASVMPVGKPRRHDTNEPKPFDGLTHKPQCALCEHDMAHPQPWGVATFNLKTWERGHHTLFLS
jgi:hypothetical protein